MPKCFPLKNSINQAHLQNGTYKQIVSHLERELELNGSEAPDDMQIITVTQQASQENSENPKHKEHSKQDQTYSNSKNGETEHTLLNDSNMKIYMNNQCYKRFFSQTLQ